MGSHVFDVENIHCSSCEDEIRRVLTELDPEARVSFYNHAQVLMSAPRLGGFEASKQLYNHGFKVTKVDHSPYNPLKHSWLGSLVASRREKELKKQHAQVCAECQTTPPREARWRAVFAVGGMTCASCAQAVTDAIRSSGNVEDVQVSVVNGSATTVIQDKTEAEAIKRSIDDSGYDATLLEVLPVSANRDRHIVAAIGGMTCASCAQTVRQAALDAGASNITVDPISGKGEFLFSGKVSDLAAAIEDTGYTFELVSDTADSLETKSRTITLQIRGIHCNRCPQRVMEALSSYGDAIEIEDAVSLDSPSVKITYVPSPPQFTIRAILAHLNEQAPELDFVISKRKSLEEIAAENLETEKHEILGRLILTIFLAIPSTIFMFWMPPTWVMLAIATPAYFFADDIFHVRAFKELRALRGASWNRKLLHFGSMNLLMSLGTSISYWASVVMLISGSDVSYFDSVIFLTFFLLVGRALDVFSKSKTASTISSVASLRPSVVDLVANGRTLKEPVEAIEIGDTIAVNVGSSCAADGYVLNGEAEVNESMLTGEAQPVAKGPGDEVYAGTQNLGNERLLVKVKAAGEGTLLDGIVQAVRQGQTHSAPIERTAEKITGVFVPVVVYIAISVWFIWTFLVPLSNFGQDLLPPGLTWGLLGMEFAIATFVVACPCGIGLAAPTALYVGSGIAAKYGILARGGGEAFEDGSNIEVVCFDKTGTITKGSELVVTDSWSKEGRDRDNILRIAARMESESAHPLAKAIVSYAPGMLRDDHMKVEFVPGRGLKSGSLLLGNERLIEENNVSIPPEQISTLQKWKSQGKSVILASQDGELKLMLAARDAVRPEAPEVIHELQAQGIQCWMISGDSVLTAQAVAAEVGIPSSNIVADVLPDEKVDHIKRLQMTANAATRHSGRAIVAMVGDGINDAPSLATADVGIALGAGADIALSSAKFVLLRDDLRAILVLIRLSRAVLHRVMFNFFWALIYNVIAIPIAAGVFYPWTRQRLDAVWASLAMALSSVSVMASSLLLKRFRP